MAGAPRDTVRFTLLTGALVALSGLTAGLAAALFLTLLDAVTAARQALPALVYALPLAGVAMGLVWSRWGVPVLPGNNLVIDRVTDGGPPVPPRMAPMVLLGTLWTHLFGGSAGREGTAVQMGAALADTLFHRLYPRTADGDPATSSQEPSSRRTVLLAGIAGGFGGVFGTPLAGAMFAVEVARPDAPRWRSLAPALFAASLAHHVVLGLGVRHTPFPTLEAAALDLAMLGRWLIFAAAVAMTVVVFIELTHLVKHTLTDLFPRLEARLFAGGCAVVGLLLLHGDASFLGLGVDGILRSFADPRLPFDFFAGKLLFTAVTLGAGFQGGEVTPLFFVGAALGNALHGPLELPLGIAAAVGLCATFGAAANTPRALVVMGAELFGAALLPHLLIVVPAATLLTGWRSIYPAQRLGRTKSARALPSPRAIREGPPPPAAPPPSSL